MDDATIDLSELAMRLNLDGTEKFYYFDPLFSISSLETALCFKVTQYYLTTVTQIQMGVSSAPAEDSERLIRKASAFILQNNIQDHFAVVEEKPVRKIIPLRGE